jgi:hypothetical protein
LPLAVQELQMGDASRTISAPYAAVNWKMGKLTMDQAVAEQNA